MTDWASGGAGPRFPEVGMDLWWTFGGLTPGVTIVYYQLCCKLHGHELGDGGRGKARPPFYGL